MRLSNTADLCRELGLTRAEFEGLPADLAEQLLEIHHERYAAMAAES